MPSGTAGTYTVNHAVALKEGGFIIKKVSEVRNAALNQTIMLRQFEHGKIWGVRPAVVIQDEPELRVFFMPPGSIWKKADKDLKPAERIHNTWSFKDSVWGFGGILRLIIPGVNYSVLLLKNSDGSLHEWYINLEEQLHYSIRSYDYEDNVLDIGAAPDLSEWGWKDENELSEMVERGIYSKDKAAKLYSEGKRAIDWLLSGESPYNKWINWQPNPLMRIPVLPKDWERI